MSEFDKFSESYTATNDNQLKNLTGFNLDYFNEYKVKDFIHEIKQNDMNAPKKILDFGCGVGNSLLFLNKYFPRTKIIGCDVSIKSLALAKIRTKDIKNISFNFIKSKLTFQKHTFDSIFSSCVFHHIEPEKHIYWLKQLRYSLKSGGVLFIYEHNPINPFTKYIFKNAEFDKNATMISANKLKALVKKVGFRNVSIQYRSYFPKFLSAFIGIEKLLKNFPFGAQYYCVCKK